ncbi:MAG: hypothetical protein KF893_00345 [Caldilineaceae bacterium]|nr:hypothetical protein [Caldilineaceae bacterium]
MSFWDELRNPSSEFSVMPFWFWNDDLDEAEIVRQIGDFQDHGAHGFVIHPRVGLPRTLGWMSDELLHFYDIAIAEAERRGMVVILYDEGMYPSGSSAGQVVAENPRFQTRCLDKIDLAAGEDLPPLPPDQTLAAVVERGNGARMAVIDRPLDAFIRGIHYIGDGPAEDEPPAGDLLNPDAVASFIRHVYDSFAARFSQYFGKTVMAIFTDEPSPVGRPRERGVIAGTTGILEHVNRILGYDFTPRLPALWYDDEVDAVRYRRDYERAVALRMEETWYRQLFEWCEGHGLPLTGHPARGDDIGAERYFHIPGQDLVWRWVLPDEPSALEGEQATQGKCSSSAMIHLGRRRNTNECCGAYGHELTWAEMNWLADWCFVRGVNQIIPHAFYYSVRGIRRDERPPDVGPNSPWWDRFPQYADRCRRLSWLNTDAAHVCQIAILGAADYLPWEPAKVCFQHQRDFNYLEERHLWEDAIVDEDGVDLVGIHYAAVIIAHEPDPRAIPALDRLAQAGRLIHFPADDLIERIDALTWPDVIVDPPSPALRVRHIIKNGYQIYLLFNEERAPLTVRATLSADGRPIRFDAATGEATAADLDHLSLAGYELAVFVLE